MPKSTTKRRWFRFSLRTLFVVVTALCLWLGWTVNQTVSQLREREQLIESFRHDWETNRFTDLMMDGPKSERDQLIAAMRGLPPKNFPMIVVTPKDAPKLPVTWRLLGVKPNPHICFAKSRDNNYDLENEARTIERLMPDLDVRYHQPVPEGP